MGGRKFYRAEGHIGLHKLMTADEAARKLIQERAIVAELFVSAVNSGMRFLKMNGMEKVSTGLTD